MEIMGVDRPWVGEKTHHARFTDQDLDDEEIGGRIHWAHPPLMQRVPGNGIGIGWSEKTRTKSKDFVLETLGGLG